MANKDISQRQQDILKLVILGHIRTSQPVSSLYITEHFDVGLSSATVRSIFSDLELHGYLYSPHRSSGRLPTERAFRFFAENLPDDLSGNQIPEEDRTLIQKEYLRTEFKLEDILGATCKILSSITNYAGVVLGPEPQKSVLKHLELIDMGEDEILIVLVTRSGTVYSKSIFLENRVPRDYLQRISRYLNEKFKGLDIKEIRENLLETEGPVDDFRQYLPIIARGMSLNLDLVSGEETWFTAGVDRLMAEMAIGQSERIRELSRLFDEGDPLRSIFRQTSNLDDVQITIEGDREPSLSGLSIVTASYKMGEKPIGSVGVVGPNRMDYIRVVRLVDYMRYLISNMVTKLSN